MQTKRQLKRCTRNVHPSFADFRPGFGVNFHILLTQNWLWESSLSLLSLWCILFQIKLCLFRENLNLKKHLGPKKGWSSLSTFWHRLIYAMQIRHQNCLYQVNHVTVLTVFDFEDYVHLQKMVLCQLPYIITWDEKYWNIFKLVLCLEGGKNGSQKLVRHCNWSDNGCLITLVLLQYCYLLETTLLPFP